MAKSAKGKSKQKAQNRITSITAGDKAAKPKKPSILATAKELAGRTQAEKSSAKTAKTSVKTKTAASKPKNSKSAVIRSALSLAISAAPGKKSSKSAGQTAVRPGVWSAR